MNSIFKQIKASTSINEEKNYVVITFPKLKLVYKFNLDRRNVVVEHKSQAVIAAVTGRNIRYKNSEIQSTNKIFEWLGIECLISYEMVEITPQGEFSDGVISYF